MVLSELIIKYLEFFMFRVILPESSARVSKKVEDMNEQNEQNEVIKLASFTYLLHFFQNLNVLK